MVKSTKEMEKSLTETKELYNRDTRNYIVDNYGGFSFDEWYFSYCVNGMKDRIEKI
jgi:hypothetical protein